jgi:hypothetical protein
MVTLGFSKARQALEDDGDDAEDADGGAEGGGPARRTWSLEGSAGSAATDGAAAAAAAGGGGGPWPQLDGAPGAGRPNGSGRLSATGSWGQPRVQRRQSRTRESAMTSGRELRAAAAAMLRHLRREHPEWFEPPPAAGHHHHFFGGLHAQQQQQKGQQQPQLPEQQAAAAAARTPPQSRPATPGSSVAPPPLSAGARAARQWRQFRALLWREAISLVRNPADVAGRMATFAFVGLLDGLIRYGLSGQASSLWDRIGVRAAAYCGSFAWAGRVQAWHSCVAMTSRCHCADGTFEPPKLPNPCLHSPSLGRSYPHTPNPTFQPPNPPTPHPPGLLQHPVVLHALPLCLYGALLE